MTKRMISMLALMAAFIALVGTVKFKPVQTATPVVFGAPVVLALFGGAPVLLGVLLAMLLAGLDGIGPATRVQVSPLQRKPSKQP